MPMENSYDVIVVGAGPAGSMAALEAARGGARTLLLEKHERIGQPVCCAEAITTQGLERVIKPDPEWIAVRIEGASIEGPYGTKLAFYHEDAGYVLYRDVFDAALALKASGVGVDVVTRSPVIGIRREGDIIQGVIVADDGEKREIRARIVIAADGVESRVAHLSGMNTYIDLNNVDTACQYLVDEIELDEMLIGVVIGNEIAPGGYAWVFPKSRNSANIGVAVCPARTNGTRARHYLDKFISARYPACRRLRTTMGAVPAFDKTLPLLQGNLMLVGDAGRLLDSLSGAGISNALISGSIAGRVAASYLRNEAGLEDYPAEFKKLKSRELYAYKLFRSIFVNASDDEFEQIISALDDFFPQKNIRNVDIPDIIFKLIFKKPGLLKLARYLLS